MKTYPFIYLNHGKITHNSYQSYGINENSFIIFKNKLTHHGRKRIMEECPVDLVKNCYFGNNFIFFNPVSNETVDEISKKFNKFDHVEISNKENLLLERLLSIIPEKALRIEDWFFKVNSICEIAVCSSPFLPDKEDEWGRWSKEKVYDSVIPIIDNILNCNPELVQIDNDETRYFFRIHEYILNFMLLRNKNE